MQRRTNNPKGDPAKRKLFEDDFFIPFDGDLFNDVEDGRVTPTEYCVYSMLLRQVDFETGIWTGSAYRIYVGWGRQLNQRTVQHCLKQLADKGLIKSFHRRGQRDDYAAAIHNYRVRYGKHKGYKLDASATTDPRQPVYHRDREAAPIPERNDPESTAQPLPNHSESSANPIARNTPEYPDVPEENRTPRPPTTPTTGEALLIDGPAETDVDAVAAGFGSLKLGDQGQRTESEQRPLDQGRFMGKVRTIWNWYLSPTYKFKATDPHIEAAIEAAAKVGEGVFLAAWDYWLNARREDMKVPNPEAPKGFEFRTWPLHYFVSSGALDELADRVRPFVGLAEEDALEFLLDMEEQATAPLTITPTNAAILRAFVDRHGAWALREPYEGQPMDAFVQEIVVPLGDKLDREEELERQAELEHEAKEADAEPDVSVKGPPTRAESFTGDAAEVETTT